MKSLCMYVQGLPDVNFSSMICGNLKNTMWRIDYEIQAYQLNTTSTGIGSYKWSDLTRSVIDDSSSLFLFILRGGS